MEEEMGTMTRARGRSLGEGSEKPDERAQGYKIQDSTLLQNSISKAAMCRACKSNKSEIQLWQRNAKRCGLAENLYLKCSICGEETPLQTSTKLPGQGGAFDVNRRSVLALEGSGRAKLSKFCSRMNLPEPVTKKAYNKHLKNIEKTSLSCASQVLSDACTRLRDITEIEEPDKIEVNEQGEKVASVSVTVDGTWQKRGHSSKIGVVFIISVRTGEVLDFEVLSQICHECVAHQNLDSSSAEYIEWKRIHSEHCQINHVGSSGDMENKGAVAMFSRSISTRCLKYTTFVGDGDSSCYGNVAAAMNDEYGDAYLVTKEECVGHVQKRMGTALMTYKKSKKGVKLADGKTVGGAGRLTDEMIKRIQNYYGFAIRQNTDDLDSMRKGVLAIQHHLIETPSESLEKQHRFCPKSKGTWCKFWSDKHDGTNKYSSANRLPAVFMKELNPIFTRLSANELLERCLKGLTQNQNESLNGLLWSKVSKTSFCGKRRVTIAVCESVSVFNTGAASKATVMLESGMVPGKNMMKALRREDKLRVASCARKISQKYRLQRKALRFGKKKKKADKSYKSGSFGLGTEPEVSKTRKRKRAPATVVTDDDKQPGQVPSTLAVEVSFIDDGEVQSVLRRKKRKERI